MKKSLYNILKECSEGKSPKERVERLQQNANPALLLVLKYTFDPNIKFLLPEGDPPYKPCEFLDQEGRLYAEAKKLYLYVEGGNPNLTKFKRESLFIQLIESVDKNDAILLCSVKDKKLPFKTLTSSIVKQAFPELY